MQYVIFDLDNTIINSKHRKLTRADGTIDLDHWIENNTPEKVQKDTLLPCVETLRKDYAAGCKIIICTSRVLGVHDYEFFMLNDVPYHIMLDRPMGSHAADADLKEFLLRNYVHQNLNCTWAQFCLMSMLYDDSESVLERMHKIRMPTIDAILWNKRLQVLAA